MITEYKVSVCNTEELGDGYITLCIYLMPLNIRAREVLKTVNDMCV